MNTVTPNARNPVRIAPCGFAVMHRIAAVSHGSTMRTGLWALGAAMKDNRTDLERETCDQLFWQYSKEMDECCEAIEANDLTRLRFHMARYKLLEKRMNAECDGKYSRSRQ